MATAPSAAATRSTTAEEDSTQSRLGMQLGDEFWLLDLGDVAEVIPVPELLSVPLTKPWFAGVANIRGNLIAVVDFAAFMGGAQCLANDKARLVLIGDKHRLNGALIFNRVVGLRQLDSFEPEPGATTLPAWVDGRFRDRDQQLWSSLNMHALVTHPDFLAVELHSL